MTRIKNLIKNKVFLFVFLSGVPVGICSALNDYASRRDMFISINFAIVCACQAMSVILDIRRERPIAKWSIEE